MNYKNEVELNDKIKQNYRHNNVRKLGRPENLVENEFEDLVNNYRLSELMSNSNFGAIQKIICHNNNWNIIFRNIYINNFADSFTLYI